MVRLRARRGKRRSVVVEVGRWRLRAVPGRFRWGFHREAYGAWTFAGKVFLVTAIRRTYAPD